MTVALRAAQRAASRPESAMQRMQLAGGALTQQPPAWGYGHTGHIFGSTGHTSPLSHSRPHTAGAVLAVQTAGLGSTTPPLGGVPRVGSPSQRGVAGGNSSFGVGGAVFSPKRPGTATSMQMLTAGFREQGLGY